MQILKRIFLLIGYGFATLFTITFLGVLAIVFLLARSDFNISEEELEISSENAVGVVELTGEIFSSGTFNAELKKQLDNEQIKALVVRIDSPGGSVGASEELYQAIKDAGEKKPVVCSLGNIAASGGLYAACGCKKIVANKGSITGSIGVVMMMPQLTSIIDKLGVEINVIKSGELKDAGSPFRKMSAKDREVFQGIISMAYDQFVDVIATSRNLPVEDVKKFADGRIILGEAAMELGLIDAIGGERQAAKLALELAGIEGEPEIIRKTKKKGLAKLLDEGLDGVVPLRWLRNVGEYQLFYRSGF